jgi:hypothetical protein
MRVGRDWDLFWPRCWRLDYYCVNSQLHVALDPGGSLKALRGRFFQAEVTLATSDPLDTPLLREIALETAPVIAADWPKTIKVVEAHNEEIVRTSIPFRYEPFTHPKLKQLRAQDQTGARTRASPTRTTRKTRSPAGCSPCTT